MAERRAVIRAWLKPISRYDSTLVISQKMNMTITSSAVTRPVIAPANATILAAKPPICGSSFLK